MFSLQIFFCFLKLRSLMPRRKTKHPVQIKKTGCQKKLRVSNKKHKINVFVLQVPQMNSKVFVCDFCCRMVCHKKIHNKSIKRHVHRNQQQIWKNNVVDVVVKLSLFFSREQRGKKYVCAVEDCLKTTSRKKEHRCHLQDLVLVKKRSDLPLNISNIIFPPPIDGEMLNCFTMFCKFGRQQMCRRLSYNFFLLKQQDFKIEINMCCFPDASNEFGKFTNWGVWELGKLPTLEKSLTATLPTELNSSSAVLNVITRRRSTCRSRGLRSSSWHRMNSPMPQFSPFSWPAFKMCTRPKAVKT